MEHVVFFPSPDGAPAFARVGTLEEAVRLVEHLRNSEGVAEVSVRPLGAEVPLAFRAYYRVEVPAAAEAQVAVVEAPLLEPVAVAVPAQPAPVEDVQPVAEAAPEPTVDAEPEPEVEAVPVLVDAGAASSNGHAGDGSKSLGFFA